MLKRNGAAAAPCVTMIDNSAMQFHLTTQGARSAGEPCQLTLALRGAEVRSFLEDAGCAAPQSVTIEMALPEEATGRAVLDALSTRPWQHADAPIIAYSPRQHGCNGGDAGQRGEAGPGDVAYLVRNRAIDDLIVVIREALDLAAPPR